MFPNTNIVFTVKDLEDYQGSCINVVALILSRHSTTRIQIMINKKFKNHQVISTILCKI